MEESVNLLCRIKESFGLTETDIQTYSPLTLAYIGDAVFDLIIRTVIVERGNRQPSGLHKRASSVVNAVTQAKMIEAVMDSLTDEEKSVYKRGRNAKSYTTAKNASVGDYRKATGFEALIGYLYLTGRMDRVFVLVKDGLAFLQLDI